MKIISLLLVLFFISSCGTHYITKGRNRCDKEMKRINQDPTKHSMKEIDYWINYCSHYYDEL